MLLKVPRRASTQDPQHMLESRKLFRDADVLWLGEKAQSFFAAFAADAAGFHSTERDAEVADEPAVYPNCSGVNFFGDAMSAVQVLGPDT